MTPDDTVILPDVKVVLPDQRVIIPNVMRRCFRHHIASSVTACARKLQGRYAGTGCKTGSCTETGLLWACTQTIQHHPNK